ncbi:hypothetical protein M3A74_08250 [Corynebacterium appendicis]|uniref:DUF6541 family protein n=1 Tax=Corynebacterium appendicis TaxID=163202 RepID=UPI00223B5B77|nr:DUF6541 family protein [Corynebacterium appendicis]MCT1684792.1 hypothetical protein [Corynebacterium appendicis]
MDAVGAVWLAIAVFTLPGLIFAWVAGAKLPAAAASSLPATFGIVGLGSWVYGAMGIRFGWTSFIVFLVLMLCLAAGWHYAFARRAKKRAAKSWVRALWPGDWRRGSIADPSWVLPGAGVVVGAWMLIAKQLELQSNVPGQLNNIVQGWDIQWHVNAVRFIMEEGIASPTRMGELQNPETRIDLFYPSAFHAATALLASAGDLAPVEAVNLASIVLPSLALTAGAAGLAWAMARGRGMVAQIAAGLAAIAVYASPVLVWIPDFVGMRPYIVAIGLSGLVIALFHQVPRDRALALPTLFAFLGMMQVHPSAVLVVVLAVLLYWLTYLVWRPDRSRVSDVLWLAIPALGATVAFLPQLIAGQTQAEEVNTWDASENVTAGEAWEKAFMMDTRHVGSFFPGFDPTILLWLAGFGAIAMVVWRGQVWAPIFYGLMTASAAHALHPFDSMWEPLLTLLGSPHYNSAHRIITVVALTVIAGAAVGAAVIIRVFTLAPVAARYGTRPWVWGTSIASAILAVLAGWGTGAWASTVAVDGAKMSFDSSRLNDRMVDDDQLKAYEWLASRPEAQEGLVMGESTDGYSWAYAIGGVPTVARHYLWPNGGMGVDSNLLADRAGQLGAGERDRPDETSPADEAAAHLNVRFIVSSGNTFWPGPKNWQVDKALWTTPGVTPVYQRGLVTIFAVNEQLSAEQITELQRDAVANGGSTELPELTPTSEASAT